MVINFESPVDQSADDGVSFGETLGTGSWELCGVVVGKRMLALRRQCVVMVVTAASAVVTRAVL